MTYGGYAVLKDGTPEQKQRPAAQGRARRTVVLFRADRTGVGFRCGCHHDPRDSERRRLRHQRPESLHLRHGHQRLLPAGDPHVDGRKEAAGHHQLPGRYAPARASRSGRSRRSANAPSAPRTCSTRSRGAAIGASRRVDRGWEAVDSYLWYERLCLSAARTGAASAAFEYALEYAKTRKQFGRPIGQFQAMSHKLADMKVMLDVSRTLVYRFAWLMDRKGRRRA